jgi:hypothetical protein
MRRRDKRRRDAQMRRASSTANPIKAPIHTDMNNAPRTIVAIGDRSSSHLRFPIIDREADKGSIGRCAR